MSNEVSIGGVIINANEGHVSIANDFSAGSITTTTGDIFSSGKVTASGNLQTSSNISASGSITIDGSINTTNGNFNTTNGNINVTNGTINTKNLAVTNSFSTSNSITSRGGFDGGGYGIVRGGTFASASERLLVFNTDHVVSTYTPLEGAEGGRFVKFEIQVTTGSGPFYRDIIVGYTSVLPNGDYNYWTTYTSNANISAIGWFGALKVAFTTTQARISVQFVFTELATLFIFG